MKGSLIILGLVLFVLISSGCISQTESQKIEKVYVCPSGVTVSDPGLCPEVPPDHLKSTTSAPITTFPPTTTPAPIVTTMPPTTTPALTTTSPPTTTPAPTKTSASIIKSASKERLH